MMHHRQLRTRLLNALGDTPVVCLGGAARTGKSALALALLDGLPEGSWFSCADPATRTQVAEDPEGFLERLPGLAFLDDVERVPALLPRLKTAVDRGGRFFLTTSRPLPGLVRDLTWRMEAFTLWPLAQAELQDGFPGLIDAAFQDELDRLRFESLPRPELLARVLAGGYPEVAEGAPSLREGWFHGWLTALVHGLRDRTELREVRHLTRLLAAPGSDPEAAKRCLELLEDLHVLASLGSGTGARYRCFNDPALQAHLLGMAPAAVETRPVLAAPLLETFAVMELLKTAPWSQARPGLTRLRAGAQELVILEDHRHQLIAFTTSAAATVQPEAFLGLRELRDRVGDRLRAGIVLHLGEQLRGAGPRLWAAPFQALWATK